MLVTPVRSIDSKAEHPLNAYLGCTVMYNANVKSESLVWAVANTTSRHQASHGNIDSAQRIRILMNEGNSREDAQRTFQGS